MSISKGVLSSSYSLIAVRTFQRSIGLISLLILARLLTPSDFAVVALTSLTVHFFNMLSNAGSEQYILQKQVIQSSDLDTAWTLDVLLKSILWLALVLLAPTISTFFNRPELLHTLYASSILLMINALRNPGILLFKRDLNYAKLFRLNITQKTLSFLLVIIIAFYTRSYWALVAGELAAGLIYTIGSYVIQSHRPYLTLQGAKQQWLFSKWLLFKGILGYCRSQIDTFIVSKFFSAPQLGGYYMMRDLAMFPANNILAPAIEPLLAAFKRLRSNKHNMAFQLRFCLFLVGIITIPLCFFIWHFPASIVETVLGQQWQHAAPVLSVMSLLLIYYSFMLTIEQALISLQQVKALFYYDLVSLVVIGLFLVSAATAEANLSDIALYRGILGIVAALALLIFLENVIKVNILRLACLLILPCTVSIITTQISLQLEPQSITMPLAKLVVSSATFFTAYLLLTGIYLYIFKHTEEIKQCLKLLKIN